MDPRLSVLREKQDAMESKINELKDMNRKRDEELQSIKETISECKNKVLGIRGRITQTSTDLGSVFTVSTDNEKNQDGIWKLADSRNFKMFGGLMALHYILSNGNCVLPCMSNFFSYIYAFITFYHFVIVTGLPLLRERIFHGNLDESTFQKVDIILMPWYHLIGAGLSLAAIQMLTMTKCQGWSVTSSIQMMTRVGSFIVEFSAFCYPEQEKNVRIKQTCSVNKITAILLGANVLTFIAPVS